MRSTGRHYFLYRHPSTALQNYSNQIVGGSQLWLVRAPLSLSLYDSHYIRFALLFLSYSPLPSSCIPRATELHESCYVQPSCKSLINKMLKIYIRRTSHGSCVSIMLPANQETCNFSCTDGVLTRVRLAYRCT